MKVNSSEINKPLTSKRKENLAHNNLSEEADIARPKKYPCWKSTIHWLSATYWSYWERDCCSARGCGRDLAHIEFEKNVDVDLWPISLNNYFINNILSHEMTEFQNKDTINIYSTSAKKHKKQIFKIGISLRHWKMVLEVRFCLARKLFLNLFPNTQSDFPIGNI